MEKECPKCKRKAVEKAKFCEFCGYKFPTQKQSSKWIIWTIGNKFIILSKRKLWIIGASVAVLAIGFVVFITLRRGTDYSRNEHVDIEEEIVEPKVDVSFLTYDPAEAKSGWVAFYDRNSEARCFTSLDFFYRIADSEKEWDELKEDYLFLEPLGIVAKYGGNGLILNTFPVKDLKWNAADDYARTFSPDGYRWRLPSETDLSILKSTRDEVFSTRYRLTTYEFMGDYSKDVFIAWTSEYSDNGNPRRDSKTGKIFHYVKGFCNTEFIPYEYFLSDIPVRDTSDRACTVLVSNL